VLGHFLRVPNPYTPFPHPLSIPTAHLPGRRLEAGLSAALPQLYLHSQENKLPQRGGPGERVFESQSGERFAAQRSRHRKRSKPKQ